VKRSTQGRIENKRALFDGPKTIKDTQGGNKHEEAE
jgi:hypothetical protein